MNQQIANRTKRYKIVLSGGDLVEESLSMDNNHFKIEKVGLKLTIESPLNKNENAVCLSEIELENLLNDIDKTEKLVLDLGMNVKTEFYDYSPREKFYKILETLGPGSIRTTQPNEFDFGKSLENISDYDAVIISTISSKLSGTYQSALLSVEQLPESDKKRVYVLDSKSVSGMVGFCAYKYLEDILKNEVEEKNYDYNKEVFMRGLISDLRYIDVGGRGEVLRPVINLISNFKIIPIVTLNEGKIKPVSVVRGEKKSLSLFNDELSKELNEKKDFYNNAILIYTGKNMRERLKESEDILREKNIKFNYLCSDFVLGTHFGTESIGYFIYKK